MNDEKEIGPQTAELNASAAPPKRSTASKLVRIIVGVLLMALGLAALFTPFTPGSWLALVGLEFLGLRLLLRNKLCRWAELKPQSRFRRAMCRIIHVDGLEAMMRKWRQRKKV
jgi:hypothetical protein